MSVRLLLIAYALVNAVLYSLLLPLWEGFDEPFHFAYVQQLANGQGLPDARTAGLSREVVASLLLAPASQGVNRICRRSPRILNISPGLRREDRISGGSWMRFQRNCAGTPQKTR